MGVLKRFLIPVLLATMAFAKDHDKADTLVASTLIDYDLKGSYSQFVSRSEKTFPLEDMDLLSIDELQSKYLESFFEEMCIKESSMSFQSIKEESTENYSYNIGYYRLNQDGAELVKKYFWICRKGRSGELKLEFDIYDIPSYE